MIRQNVLVHYLEHTFSLKQALGWIGIAFLTALLGVHFFRASEYGLMACCMGIIILHCGHAEWKRYAISLFLLWGAFEWATTASLLAQMRMHAGLPWIRAMLILCGVGFITGLGGIVLYLQKKQVDDGDPYARLKGIIFFSAFCAIYYLSQASPVPLLLLERYFPRWGTAETFFIAWYSVFIASVLLNPESSKKGRKLIWLVFSLVFFGQLALGLLGFEELLMTGTLHIPVPGFIVFGPIFRGGLTIMLLLVFIATILVGSSWCSMLCYFGPFDSFCAGNKPVKPIPAGLKRLLRHGRPCVLTIGVGTALLLRLMEQPLEIVLSIALLFVCTSLLVIGIISRKYNSMLHCTAFCPMGVIINSLGKISPWRIRIDPTKCDHCGTCETICKYRAITAPTRQKGKTAFQCSLCMDCIPACKKQAIALQSTLLPVSYLQAKDMFLTLLIIVHAIFIAFARV